MEPTTGFTGFDPKIVSDSFFKMMRYSLNTTFDSLRTIQELNDKIVKDIVREWSENSKKGWDQYRKVVEKGFKQAEELVRLTK